MNGGGVDPVEEVRHREVMDGMGVYDAQWALSKVLELSDIEAAQNRLLLTKDMVRAGPIPKVFPELEELGEDGQNAELKVDVTAIDEGGQEQDVLLRYLNSNKAYRVMGPRWRSFVVDTGMTRGERLDLYTCRRGDGQRCLFFFRTKGWDGSGGSAAWCTKVRKRARQPAATAVTDPDDDQVFLVNGGRADGDNGKHCGDVDYTPAKRDRRRRVKNGSFARNQDHILVVTNDGMQAWSGDLQDEASWDLHLSATPNEREAAKGLLMLKYGTPY